MHRDVLHVCMSPIISSLCPLPIGTIESMHIIPVHKDSDTDLRSKTLGEGDSTIHLPKDVRRPRERIRLPRPSSNVPRVLSPTYIERTLRVPVTNAP
jgi:hypothetical protein